jgi:hypothetical protein
MNGGAVPIQAPPRRAFVRPKAWRMTTNLWEIRHSLLNALCARIDELRAIQLEIGASMEFSSGA